MRYWTNTLTLTSGCTKVSDACKNCWAETNHNRFMRRANKKYDHDFSNVRVHHENINASLKVRGKPKVFAVWNDAFHEAVPFDVIDHLFCRKSGSEHTLLICTKRPERIVEYLSKYGGDIGIINPIENIYLGTTVENQEQAGRRIPELLKCKPFKLFLSVEPMLSAITIPHKQLKNIAYVLVGCESGQHARQTKFEWIKDLQEQCLESGTPLWVKQVKINGKMVHDYLPLSTIKKEDLWK